MEKELITLLRNFAVKVSKDTGWKLEVDVLFRDERY